MLEARCLMASLLDYRPKDEEFKHSLYPQGAFNPEIQAFLTTA